MGSIDRPAEPAAGAPARSRAARWRLERGGVIPAHPLALTAARRLDERRQRALSRYYLAAGASGLAVGVHTTQFGIHDPATGLLRPVLALAAEEMNRAEAQGAEPLVRVAGICGDTAQAIAEAELARELGYDFGLVSLAALVGEPLERMLEHCRAIGEVLGVFGFYLQPSVGGVRLPYRFWRRFCELERAVAIKVAAFNRYQTLDVVRAVADSRRTDVALYTGNDDHIMADLLCPLRFASGGETVELRFVGGLLGQWAMWTARAVELLADCRRLVAESAAVDPNRLAQAMQLTDANGAIFDAAHDFRGCVPGIHEVLRRQGLLAGTWCLDEQERLSPGQLAEIDRIYAAYPSLRDDDFVAAHLDEWLGG